MEKEVYEETTDEGCGMSGDYSCSVFVITRHLQKRTQQEHLVMMDTCIAMVIW